ncbi:MAG: IS1380 family transposase [Bacteriovorax sp.]|nr:IS1380 family transposase [Bacteriovorax sp.]
MKNIVIEETNKDLSANGGLLFFNSLFERLDLAQKLDFFMPELRRTRGVSQIDKIKSLLFSFASGSDCLDDLNEIRNESLYAELCSGGVSARAMGDFLRSFRFNSIDKFRDFLVEQSLQMRMAMHPDSFDFILNMDSTPHEQDAKKMEGLAWNYKNMWCLDSQNAYDQFGFSYDFDLRAGNTFSAEGSEVMVRRVFKKVPKHLKRYFRGDSAYGRKSLYDELINANVKFTIVLRENLAKRVRQLLSNKNSMEWKKTELEFFDSTECETASGLYPIKDLAGGLKHLRVVFIRAQKKDIQLSLLDDLCEDGYLHYSIITNLEEVEMDNEKVIEFYRGRGNAENFIREQKNGFDFHHFPCQKLDANRVYGLVGTLAYNMTRFLSFFISNNGCFSKKVRNKLIKLPCQVVHHARKLIIKFNKKIKEVVENILKIMTHKLSKFRLQTD